MLAAKNLLSPSQRWWCFHPIIRSRSSFVGGEHSHTLHRQGEEEGNDDYQTPKVQVPVRPLKLGHALEVDTVDPGHECDGEEYRGDNGERLGRDGLAVRGQVEDQANEVPALVGEAQGDLACGLRVVDDVFEVDGREWSQQLCLELIVGMKVREQGMEWSDHPVHCDQLALVAVELLSVGSAWPAFRYLRGHSSNHD